VMWCNMLQECHCAIGQIPSCWANPSLGGTIRNHLKEWLRNQKQPKSFFWALFVKYFHNYKLLFFHVYRLHALIYGLKFI
jgi:hypothetical protein